MQENVKKYKELPWVSLELQLSSPTSGSRILQVRSEARESAVAAVEELRSSLAAQLEEAEKGIVPLIRQERISDKERNDMYQISHHLTWRRF